MRDYIARQDFVLAGSRVVRKGETLSLGDRMARYPRIRGWIEAVPEAEDSSAEKASRRRSGKGS